LAPLERAIAVNGASQQEFPLTYQRASSGWRRWWFRNWSGCELRNLRRL